MRNYKKYTEEEIVYCMECKEVRKRLTSSHLLKCCGLTLEEYKLKYPAAKTTNDRLIERMSGKNNPCYNEYKEYNNPGAEGEKVQCMLCEKWYIRIDVGHIQKMHNIGPREYSIKFPNVKLISGKYLEHDKERIKRLPKGAEHWTYGKFRSAEEKEKISKSLQEFYKNNTEHSRRHSEVMKAKYENGFLEPWNKGKMGVYSEEHNKHHSEVMKAKFEDGLQPWNKGLIGEANPLYGTSRPSEVVAKIRLSHIERRNKLTGQIVPGYNSDACKFFDFLNFHLGWQGFYAENGGEFYIEELGYWVDYYEKNINLIVEWYEEHHYRGGKVRDKDVRRREDIINKLGCAFIEIREKDKVSYPELAISIINQLIL